MIKQKNKKPIKVNINYSGFKIIYRQWQKTNQWDFIIVDKFNTDKRIGSSYKTYSDAINYLLECGLINCRTFYPFYSSLFIE
jgi:ribonuclease HIII